MRVIFLVLIQLSFQCAVFVGKSYSHAYKLSRIFYSKLPRRALELLGYSLNKLLFLAQFREFSHKLRDSFRLLADQQLGLNLF